MTEVVLHLGSNLGYKEINLELARVMISNHVGDIVAISQLYETAPWGDTDQDAFINQALICHSADRPKEVLASIHMMEAKMGRVKARNWGPRIIDIDILFYGEEIIENPNLKIPHPELTNRSFVLVPLLDICPQKVHPLLKKSITTLQEECTDTAEVSQYTAKHNF